jgi:cytochrome P450 family 4
MYQNFYYPIIGAPILYGGSLLIRRIYKWYTSPLRSIPGPPLASFLFGYMLVILREPFLDPHKRWWSEYRKKHDGTSPPFIAYNNFFGSYSLCVFDPDIVKLVLMDPASRDPVRFAKNYNFLKSTIGLGLVTLEGSAWSRHRRLIQPSFQNMTFLKGAIAKHANECTDRLIAAWNKRNSRDNNVERTIDVASHMSAVTLDIIGEVAFSHDFGATNGLKAWAESDNVNVDEAITNMDPLIQSMHASMKLTFMNLLLSILNLSWLEHYINPKEARTRKLLNDAVDAVVSKARQETIMTNVDADSNTKTPAPIVYHTKSLLQLLFDATTDENTTKLSNIELRDEVKTFIIAGHETTSTWCYWALYALAKYPDVQQKVYNNIVQHSSTETTHISIDEIDNMDYLGVFMTEVLRLYSPVGLVFRFTTREEVWHGYKIPCNTRVILPIHLLNRHPDHFTKPEEFIPERWFDKEECTNRHKFCFIPFSAGGRNCVGQRFAEMEAKLIIAKICRAFTVRLAPSMEGKEISFNNFISMKSKPRIQIEVQQR